MQINLRKPTNKFTTLQNSFLQNKNLSISAKGLGAWIFSLPENWHFNEAYFYNSNSRNGEKSIKTALKELEENNILFRQKIRDEKGRFCGAIWYFNPEGISDEEKLSIMTKSNDGFIGDGFCIVGKRATTNNNKKIPSEKKEINNLSHSLSESESDEREIEDFLEDSAIHAKNKIAYKKTLKNNIKNKDSETLENFENFKKSKMSNKPLKEFTELEKLEKRIENGLIVSQTMKTPYDTLIDVFFLINRIVDASNPHKVEVEAEREDSSIVILKARPEDFQPTKNSIPNIFLSKLGKVS